MSAIIPHLFRVRVPGPEDGPDFREVRTLPAEAADTPETAALRAGVMYGLLCLPAAEVERLARLAGELARHVAERVLSDTLLLVTDYHRGLVTISVIAPAGEVWKQLDPRSLTHVEPADQTGVIQHDMGPSAYIQVQAVRS
ncbi:hypothetical protein ABTY59_33905 [Streptomyces sp. NPDC096079]|uniref:hypothetical protein n=1 Tax=Streptomyces sp. NPDC096079 TaxID=3155820 RepID=UPI0033263BF7